MKKEKNRSFFTTHLRYELCEIVLVASSVLCVCVFERDGDGEARPPNHIREREKKNDTFLPVTWTSLHVNQRKKTERIWMRTIGENNSSVDLNATM